MHSLIIGETGSGKTTTARDMADTFRASGVKIVVLDPWKGAAWNADYITDNADDLLATLKESRCCAVFIDECNTTLARNPKYDMLAGAMRHYGHRCHFLAQRFSQVTPGIRDNCQTLLLFACGLDYARLAAKEYNDPKLLEAASLKEGYYIVKRRFRPALVGKTHWAD